MVHLVYCDDKEKVFQKILDGSKTMIIRAAAGRKIPHSRVHEEERLYRNCARKPKPSLLGFSRGMNDTKLSEEERQRIMKIQDFR